MSPVERASTARLLVELTERLLTTEDLRCQISFLVETTATLVPGVDVGVILEDDTGVPELVAASTRTARAAELFQLRRRSAGPVAQSWETGDEVSLVDPDRERRWPAFARLVRSLGYVQVHCIPMSRHGDLFGTMNLYAVRTPLSPAALDLGRSAANLAALGIATRRAHESSWTEREQLRTALRSRVVIEQAKGKLAESNSVDVTQAFELIRDFARSHRMSIRRTAEALVDGSLSTSELVREPRD